MANSGEKGEEPKKLRDELDKLREEQRTLKDQLRRLEAPAEGGQRMENG